MQLDLAMMLILEMAHDVCENTYFSECSLQLFIVILQSAICTLAFILIIFSWLLGSRQF